MKLSKKSLQKLTGVNPLLAFFAIRLMQEMNERKKANLNYTDFSIFEGLRTVQQQEENVKKGVSWTLNSKHLYGEAIDLVVYIPKIGVTWDDKKYKNQWNTLIKIAIDVIQKNKLPIINGFEIWGKDKPHFQINHLNVSKNNFNYLKKFF